MGKELTHFLVCLGADGKGVCTQVCVCVAGRRGDAMVHVEIIEAVLERGFFIHGPQTRLHV